MTDDIERDGRGTSEPVMSNEYKVIIVGAVGVGKTSLLLRYVHNHFQDSANKFISEERKTVSVNGKELVLCLWDTAGSYTYILHSSSFLLSFGTSVCSYTRPMPIWYVFSTFWAICSGCLHRDLVYESAQ